MSLVKTLSDTLTPGRPPENLSEASNTDRELWRHRYYKAIKMFREAGIETVSAEEEGAEAYIALRTCWNRYVVALASYMVWPMDEIDTAMAHNYAGPHDYAGQSYPAVPNSHTASPYRHTPQK